MEKRALGNTGHESSIVTFGSISLSYISQKKADELIELALSHGVNHFDTAPSYGNAELKLKPMLEEYRDEIFLACKTGKRTKEGAWEELNDSLERMGVDHIDLYQFHAVTKKKEIEQIFNPGGALEAFREAKEEGLIDNIGLSTHGKPDIIKEFIERVELDTVLFPLNFSILAKDDPKYDVESILDLAEDKLHEIDSSIILYGEPWSAIPPQLDHEEQMLKGAQKKMNIAAFNDHFRDAIKGDTNGDIKGFVNGTRIWK